MKNWRKPRWLVFNKIDLMDKAEAEAKAKAIADAMDSEQVLSDLCRQRVGVKDLCWDMMTFIVKSGCSGRRGETA